MNITQGNDFSNTRTVIPDCTFQQMHANSTVDCIRRWGNGSLETLHVSKEDVAAKETENEANLRNTVSCKIMNIHLKICTYKHTSEAV